jgi:hypothetical protein
VYIRYYPGNGGVAWERVVYVDELEIDEYNTVEMARHGVTPREVRQVLNNAPRFFRNKRGHRATHIMIGPTDGGRMLTVPLTPTSIRGEWRPATAFDAGRGDRARYAT